MSYLRCLFAHSGVLHILCCVFVCLFFRLMYPVFAVSPDYSFFIALSVFSNVYH